MSFTSIPPRPPPSARLPCRMPTTPSTCLCAPGEIHPDGVHAHSDRHKLQDARDPDRLDRGGTPQVQAGGPDSVPNLPHHRPVLHAGERSSQQAAAGRSDRPPDRLQVRGDFPDGGPGLRVHHRPRVHAGGGFGDGADDSASPKV